VLNGEATPFDSAARFVIRERLGTVLPVIVGRI